MTARSKASSSPSDLRQLKAKAVVALKRKADAIEGQLKGFRDWFIEQAAGERLVEIVTGHGRVTVTASSPGGVPVGSETVTIFNPDKFHALPEVTRKLLIDEGVVQISTVTRLTGASAPSFRVTLND